MSILLIFISWTNCGHWEKAMRWIPDSKLFPVDRLPQCVYGVLLCATACYCVLPCITMCYRVLLWTGWHSVLYSWTPDREQKDWLSLLLNSCPVPNYRMPFEFSMLHRIEIIVESFEEKNSKFLSLYCRHTRCPLKQFFILVVIVIRTGMDGSSEWAINCLIIRRGNTKPLSSPCLAGLLVLPLLLLLQNPLVPLAWVVCLFYSYYTLAR